MIKTIRVLALSLTLGVWATVNVDALNAKQIAQISANAGLISRGIIDRSQDGTLNLLGPGQQRAVDCGGNTVQITGNDGNINLQGTCREVVLVGNDNLIQIETVGAISVTGNDNQITWASGMKGTPPQVSQSGNDNVVSPVE